MACNPGFRCAACQGGRTTTIGPTHGGEYRRCLDCGLEASVIPEGESADTSFNAAQQDCYVDQDVLGSPLMRLMHHWAAAARLRVVRRYLSRGRLLEVGPGGGELMVLARAAGFQVAGIEHSERLAHRLGTELGLEVACGTIEEADLSQSRIDAVLSLHVIEHVPDPWRHLSAARQAVTGGGFLFLGTPNLGGWSRRVAGKRWPGYSAGHLHLFRASSLKRLLERAGWRLVKVHTLEPVMQWPWTLTTMRRKPREARSLNRSGELTRRFPYPLTAAAAHVYGILSWPARCLQGGLKGGAELLVVAQANA